MPDHRHQRLYRPDEGFYDKSMSSQRGFWMCFMWRHTVRGQRSSRLFTGLKTWFKRAVSHARRVCLQLCLDKFLRWSIIKKKTEVPQRSPAFSLNRSKEIVLLKRIILCCVSYDLQMGLGTFGEPHDLQPQNVERDNAMRRRAPCLSLHFSVFIETYAENRSNYKRWGRTRSDQTVSD